MYLTYLPVRPIPDIWIIQYYVRTLTTVTYVYT